jgi:hypothetical protein
MERSKSACWMLLTGLIVSGCASDGKIEPESVSSTFDGGTAVSGSTTSGRQASISTSPSPATSTNLDRIASGSVEDTLNDCLSRVPRDASEGQKLLAEQSCRRDFPSHR